MKPRVNSPCYCGSGKKYKRCYNVKDQASNTLHDQFSRENSTLKYSADMPCGCGSGKKYKLCCRSKDRDLLSFFEKARNGELVPFARVSSSDSSSSQIEIGKISVTRGGKAAVYLDEKLTLSTNKSVGDKTQNAKAQIYFPNSDLNDGVIRTIGNASVTKEIVPTTLSLLGAQRTMKADSENGVFAKTKIGTQKNTGQQYFDLYFGISGEPELRDSQGIKQRPHISFFPNGSGNYIRLSQYRCELEGEMTYVAADKRIVPQCVRVRLFDHKEILGCILIKGSQISIPHIPPKSNRVDEITYSKRLYKKRNLIERCFNKLKQFRHIATRYDRSAFNYLAMIKIASARLWLRFYEPTA